MIYEDIREKAKKYAEVRAEAEKAKKQHRISDYSTLMIRLKRMEKDFQQFRNGKAMQMRTL